MRRTEWRWLILLLVLAAGFRIYASIYYTCRTNTDDAVSAMMAQHIAEGRHFPPIHYNSPYVGTFELYIGALFHRWLPHSLLPSLLGFALISFLALPLFYLWARRTAGVQAALYGLTLLLIGTPEFFARNVFIGYPTVFFSGMAVCWLTVRIIDQAKTDGRVGRDAFFLGLFAGLGWWTNGLTVVYMLPCALLIALLAPLRKWGLLLVCGAAGGLLGAGPWLLYSLQQSAVMRFVTDVSISRGGNFTQSVIQAVRMSVSVLGADVAGMHPLRWSTAAVYVLLLSFSLIVLFVRWRQKTGRFQRVAYGLMPWLIIGSNYFTCGVSNRFAHVPATRYLLPVVPAVALLAGSGAAWIERRLSSRFRWTGLLCVVILAAAQFAWLPNYRDADHREWTRVNRGRVEDLVKFSDTEGIEAFYGDFFTQWMSFASNERLKITSFPYYFDRYRPFREAAILTTNLAVIDDYHGLSSFLAVTPGEADRGHAGGFRLDWNIRRSRPGWDYLPAAEVESVQWEDGTSAWEIMDDNLDTPIGAGHIDRERPRLRERTVHVRLRSPQLVTGVHAWGPSGKWGGVLRVSALDESGSSRILHDGLFHGWFWSGKYPFLSGPMAHFETLFPAVSSDALLITLQAIEDSGASMVSALRILTAEADNQETIQDPGEVPVSADPVTVLLDWLGSNPPPMLYAPRWIAELVRQRLPAIPNVIPADLYDQYGGMDRYSSHPVLNMVSLPEALLIVPLAARERTVNLLGQRRWDPAIIADIGPWSLIRVRECEQEDVDAPLYWTEYGVFLGEPLFQENLQTILAGAVPLVSDRIEFRRGMALEALAIETSRLYPGAEFRMVYGWSCPARINPNQWAVFVHFRQAGKTFFQDDHVWLANVPSKELAKQPDGWIFSSVREFRIPDDAPPGVYTIAMGLYDRVNLKRLRPRGAEPPVKGKSVILTDVLVVEDRFSFPGAEVVLESDVR